MAIAKNLSGLSATTTKAPARAPEGTATLAPLLAEAWAARFVDPEPRPMASEDARIRHSWAGTCSRALGYRLLGVTEKGKGLADEWRLGLGREIHEWWQDALQVQYPDAEVEVQLITELGTAGHADAVVTIDGVKVLIELKTINGFGFKKAVGARGPADGPRHSYVLQAALNALAANCDEVWIVYVSLENLSNREAEKMGATEAGRFSAEWHFTREQWEPLAYDELARFADVMATVDAGDLPPREIPDPELPAGAQIYDPAKGRWEVRSQGLVTDTGSYWGCTYCPMQDRCVSDWREGK